jgi:hypothetical protein
VKNKIVYHLYSNMPLIRDITYKVNDKVIDSVKITAQDGYLYLHFFIKDEINDLELIRKSTRTMCYKIMNVISIEHRALLGYPQEHEVIFNGKSEPRQLDGRFAPQSNFPKTNDEILQLERRLENLDKYSDDYIVLFRNAMQNWDDVGRFILLYSILLLIKGNQTAVDNYIYSLDKTVETRKSTNFKKKIKLDKEYKKSLLPAGKETIYTWLRNAIGHTKEEYSEFGLTWEQIVVSIEQNVDKLAEIVRKSIIEKLDDTHK